MCQQLFIFYCTTKSMSTLTTRDIASHRVYLIPTSAIVNMTTRPGSISISPYSTKSIPPLYAWVSVGIIQHSDGFLLVQVCNVHLVSYIFDYYNKRIPFVKHGILNMYLDHFYHCHTDAVIYYTACNHNSIKTKRIMAAKDAALYIKCYFLNKCF